MTPKEVLIAAKALIDTPEKWGQGAYYVPNTGARCAVGAIKAVKRAHWRTREKAEAALRGALPPRFGMSIIRFNDIRSRRHKDIMGLFDRAIEAAGHS